MKKMIIAVTLLGAGFFLYLKTKRITNEELDSMSKQHNGLNIPASTIDFETIDGFSESEFQDQLNLLDAQVIYVLVKLRAIIGRIKISPADEAIARTTGSKTTMHYADLDVGRLSTAIDIMPLDVDLETAYKAALTIPEIGAIGAYPEWNPMAGLHVDLRKRKAGNFIASWSRRIVNGKIIDSGIDKAFA